jgi:hypothetical protein
MKEIPDFELDPETFLALDLIAVERGCSIEKVLSDALDQFILREKGMNN